MAERRLAWAEHRKAMTRLILAKADWVPVLLFASILMSPEARLDLAGFALFPYRLALAVSLPFLIIKASREPVRVGFADLVMIFSAVWMFLATAAHYTIDISLKTGGAATFDALAAYLVGRLYFRNSIDLRRFLYRITPLVIGAAFVLFVESISHRYLFRPFVGMVTGHSPAAILNRMYEIRNGFLRATGPFQHPIAAGLFFATLLPLFLAADLPVRRWIGALACVGGVFSWSSAGIASLAAGLALGFYDQFQRKHRIGWMPVVLSVLTICIMIQSFVQGGLIRFIIRYASLNPATGYYRLAIFQYGWADVERHPWIGIGYFGSYLRPAWMGTESVDNFWLLQALRYGIPGMVLFLVGAWAVIIKLGMMRQRLESGSLTGRRMATGLVITLVILLLSIISVAPWAADMAWLMVLLGMAGGLSDPLNHAVAAATTPRKVDESSP